MMMISGDWKQYSGLFSREVGYQYAIRTVVQEMRGLMNVGAETWEIGYEYEWSRDDSVRDGAEKNAAVRELQMQMEFNTETEFHGRDR